MNLQEFKTSYHHHQLTSVDMAQLLIDEVKSDSLEEREFLAAAVVFLESARWFYKLSKEFDVEVFT